MIKTIKNWFEKKPIITKDKIVLSKTYNEKYGHYDYSQDSRVVDESFLKMFEDSFSNDKFGNVIICGANSGYEVNIVKKLKPKVKITAVDISDVSLEQARSHFSDVEFLHEDLENLNTIKSKAFDLYICLRAIHSSNVDIEKAISEAIRITKNKIVISISNGYLIDSKLVKGMYDYGMETIDKEKPYILRDKISALFDKLNWKTDIKESEAEILIIATPK